MAGVTEAKEEGVSRRKGWSVTVQPTQSEFMVRMDRFSRAEETGRLPTIEVKITTPRPTGWTLHPVFLKNLQ